MPVLSIEFSEVDYLRVRLGAADPMWDTLLSLRVLQAHHGLPTRLQQWKNAAGRVVSTRMSSCELRELLTITSGVTDLPRFLTTQGDGQHIDRFAQVADEDPRNAMADLARIRPWTSDVARLHDEVTVDGTARLRRMAKSLARYHEIVSPVLIEQRESDLRLDERRRAALLSDGGVEQVLASCEGTVCEPPVLKIQLRHDSDRTVALGGRGITLRPSWFCGAGVQVSIDTARSAELVHSLMSGDLQNHGAPSKRSLDSLLGRTRTLILLSCDGRSSSDVAQRLGLSASTVSEHLSVLRDAGLIVTTKSRTRSRHTWTTSAVSLLWRAGATR